MSHSYKTPGILRAGFLYQDLIGVEVLLQMYRDPALYAWVKLEAEDPQFRSVDDIVACRRDGSFDLLQVKFTPTPGQPATALSWTWLLQSASAASRSLLQKWAAPTAKLEQAGQLASAALRTDRVPDQEFSACLVGEYVDYDLIPALIKAKVEAQLQSETDARAFFRRFAFRHSEDQLADLEYRLKAKVVPSDTDNAGWLAFINQVWVWATLKDRPRAGGEIHHQDLAQYITRQAPKPIPQDFRVPEGYEAPDRDFHLAFTTSVSETDGVSVLWGTPGRGKSTYLSFCAARQRRKNEVWIRHHYFLSTTDNSTARFYVHEIAQSLIAQIRAAVPEASGTGGDLRGWIASAGSHLGAQGGRLVVVIDGLDHVWRERRSLEHMAQLFNNLLPLSPFVSLVVRTQKVPDEQLPTRLLEVLPKDRWTELPLMSQQAVRSWLAAQKKAGRLQLNGQPWESETCRFHDVSTAFHAISNGLPLHLIYSFEALVRRSGAISADDVRRLPSCPDGDIRNYYRALWTSIGPRARELLHTLAGVQFPVPGPALWDIFDRTALEAEAIEQIAHLLERRPIGLLPFHGSVFAYVRELDDHASVFQAHGPRIVQWLDSKAPAYWRWAWLWVTRAQLGEPEALLRGPTRTWAVEAMANGFPLDQIKTIIEQAETLAFEAMDLPRTFELRSIYTRAANAPEFQMRDMDSFLEVASRLSSEEYPLLSLRDALLGLAPGQMLIALRSLGDAERTAAAREVLKELDRRTQDQEPEEHFASSRADWRREMVRTAALIEDVRISRVIRYAKHYGDGDGLMTEYARESLLAGKASHLVGAAKLFDGAEFRREVTAALCLDGVTATAVGLPKTRGASALLRSWCRLKGDSFGKTQTTIDLGKILGPTERYETYHKGTQQAVYELFFTAFAAALERPNAKLRVYLPQALSEAWLAGLFADLEQLAVAMAEAWTAHSQAPSMAAFFAGIETVRPYAQSYSGSREVNAVRLGMFDIAFDLQVLAAGLNPSDLVAAGDITQATASPWWLDELWLKLFINRRLRLHSADGAEAFAGRMRRHLDVTVTEFAERAEAATHLSMFAYDNGLMETARAELRRTADCALGYGWRKDGFAFEILNSIEHLLEANSAVARVMLLQIASAYDAITDFTDGDETNHARSEYYTLLAQAYPTRGVACYEALLQREDWRYADELLQSFVKSLPDDVARNALLRTFVQTSEFNVVAELDGEGRASGVLSYLNTINGQAKTTRKLSTDRTGSVPQDRKRRRKPIDVWTYPADQFGSLVEALRKRGSANFDGGEAVVRWLNHWDAHGKGLKALQQLHTFVAEGNPTSMFDRTLDVAFEMSLRLEGRTRAFDWAVLAHRHRYGWQRYWTSHSEATARLDIVAREFPDRWQEFIVATSEPVWTAPGERSSRVIGMDRLVYFLTATGRLALAEAYLSSMVQVLLNEVSNQPLAIPKWAA